MFPPQASAEFYRQQQQIAAVTTASARKLWRRMGEDFAVSWAQIAPRMLETVQLGRAATVATAATYTPAVLRETKQVAPATGTLNPDRFIRDAPDGRRMDDLLGETVIRARVAVGSGATTRGALGMAESWLTGMLLTVLADTRRSVIGADIAQRPALGGYVRMLNAPSCSRCVVLAGKFFRWNAGFQRHPHCDCIHVPTGSASSAKSAGFISDPYEYFNSLSKAEQEKVFGRIEARSIRDGADIYRVVNIQQRGLATAKGHLRYGTPSKMTVDDIYRVAGTRTNAIRLLEREGYITGPQVAGGNILGNREGFGQFGKGGQARAASDAVTAARTSGVRDPLNRYTMTAAERRLYDAKYRLDVARTGVYPRSIGQNSADLHVLPRRITPSELATIERAYQNELSRLSSASQSVQHLARLLGLH